MVYYHIIRFKPDSGDIFTVIIPWVKYIVIVNFMSSATQSDP